MTKVRHKLRTMQAQKMARGLNIWVGCEPVREKTNNLGSDQVCHKPACTVTENG